MHQFPSNRIITSTSPEQTLQIGSVIGKTSQPNTVITLAGTLGAGKTWLAKGIAYGIDVPDYEYVNSPAYDLVHEYEGRLTVYHLDLYRLDSLTTDDLLMIQDYYEADGVCIIEWPSKLEKYSSSYPKYFLAIQIEANNPANPNERTLQFSAQGEEHDHLLEQMAQKLNL